MDKEYQMTFITRKNYRFFLWHKKKDKLQITPLKFKSDWILPPEVWGVYLMDKEYQMTFITRKNYNFFLWHQKNDKLQITLLKFGSDWILYFEVSEFGFYPWNLGCLDFTSWRFRTWILPPKV